MNDGGLPMFMSDYQNYAAYGVEEFIADDYFLQWAKHPDERSDGFWQTFLLLYPGKEAEIQEAQRFILSINPEQPFTMAERKALWSGIQQNIHQKPNILSLPAGRTRTIRIWGRAAAIIAVLLLFSAIFSIYYQKRDRTLHAVYGQKRTVLLPDGSEVVLNGNSEIRYAGNFKDRVSREVWIQGEAYFNVRHLNRDPRDIRPGERFVVHANNLNIEVLGTQFNVNTRHGDAEVSLNSGSIRLSFNDRRDTLTLKPGELVDYNKNTLQYARTTINPYHYSSWVDNKLILDNTSFADIVHILDDIYGLKIILSDTTLLNEKLSGEIPSSNENEMIRALSKTMNIQISRQENNILVINRAN